MNAGSLARALSGNLTYDAVHENNLDKLISMSLDSIGPARESHLNALGVSLIAFHHAQLPRYHVDAVKRLGEALAWRNVKNRGAVAKQAIFEKVIDMCPCCFGTKEVHDSLGVVKSCLACHASGKRRYSDGERNLPGKPMKEAHSLISLAIDIALKNVRRRFPR